MTPEDEGEAKEQREWAAILEEERLKEEEVNVFLCQQFLGDCSVFYVCFYRKIV